MRINLPAALIAAAFLAVPALSSLTPAVAQTTTAAAPAATMPPQIIHLYTNRTCSILHKTVAPAIGMMIQNDKTIAKSPDLFKQYNFAMGYGSQGSQDMAVMRMENLVGPLADNVMAIHKELDDPNAFPPVARNEEDRRLLKIKDEMLRTLATQEGALDIINGFVTTQQLSEMQHEGFGYIGAITDPQTTKSGAPPNGPYSSFYPTPPPGSQNFDDSLTNAGLPANPYQLDLSRLPGLTLGYNPVSRLKDGVEWTQSEGAKQEDTLSKDVIDAAKSCESHTTVVPAATPTP